MPIYEFSCQSCGTEFEMKRSFSDVTMPPCPKCASADVQRQLSRPAIHFKGSGWYINDSKNGNKNATSADTNKEEVSKSDASGEKPSETKTEGAKETVAKETGAKDVKEKPAETTPKSKVESSAA